MFDKIVSLLMFLLGLATIYFSKQMPEPLFAGQLGPGVFPFGIGILLVVVSVFLFIESRANEGRKEKPEWDKNLLLCIIILILYVIAFKPLGFIISSFLLILLMGWNLGARKWVPLLAVSLLFPGVIYFLFAQLGITLP